MKRLRQRGVALLTAMLTVTLVATFASAALWQQWRSVEIEAAERSRLQMQWVLNGALDWARLILQEDARNGEVDHLSEPWALPLQEARLSSFLALDAGNTDDAMEAFLSGQISDQQGLLNVRNLVQAGKANTASVQAFGRLFTLLKLPRSQLDLLVDGLLASDAALPGAPLKPMRLDQLVWLGLPGSTVRALSAYATLLPQATPLNLNTAGAETLYAALPGLDLARAQQMVTQRTTAHFKILAEAFKAAGITADQPLAPDPNNFSVGSHFFAVRGRLRLGESVVQEVSLVERSAGQARVVWRQREALSAAPLATSTGASTTASPSTAKGSLQ